MKRFLTAIVCFALCATIAVVCVEAHPGRTDSNGGHYNHSTGEYHYHHGKPEHDHYDMDGDGDIDCPYVVREQEQKQKEEEKNKRYEKSKKFLEPCFIAVFWAIMAFCAYLFIRCIIDIRNESKFYPVDYSSSKMRFTFSNPLYVRLNQFTNELNLA